MRRWATRLGLTLTGALLILIFGVLPYFLAGAFTVRTFQMRDPDNEGVTPASLGLTAEDVSFASRDGIPLSGWWVPADAAKGTVVLVHGLNRSRLEMVRKMPFLHAQGWNALAFDLRRHGQSGGSVRSLGWGEHLDVLGAVDFAKQRSPSPVVAWGISFGAAAVMLAAAEEPRIAGVVCDSSYRNLYDTAYHHLALFKEMAARPPTSSSGDRPSLLGRLLRTTLPWVPAWPIANEAVFWMGQRGHFDPAALDIVKAAAKLGGRPALCVGGSGDERMPPEIAKDLQAAAGPQADLLIVKTEKHGHAYPDATQAYEQAVTKVLEEVVRE